jgi:hypothetical protein
MIEAKGTYLGIADTHFFLCEARDIEKSVVESFMEKAQAYAEKKLPEWKISALARTLSDKALEQLKKQVTQEFPSEKDTSLITVFLLSRQNYFVITLPEDLKNRIKKGGPDFTI